MWARAPGKDRGNNSPGGKKLIVYSNRAVADNLRTQVQKLKDKIEAAKKFVEKGPLAFVMILAGLVGLASVARVRARNL